MMRSLVWMKREDNPDGLALTAVQSMRGTQHFGANHQYDSDTPTLRERHAG